MESKPLAAHVDGPFRVSVRPLNSLKKALLSHAQEAQTGIIDLPDDDPETVELMLRYLYTGDYVVAATNVSLSRRTLNVLLIETGPTIPYQSLCFSRQVRYFKFEKSCVGKVHDRVAQEAK